MPAPYRAFAALAGIIVAGCVASPDAKQASTAMTAAIDEYSRNIEVFQNLWIAEIEKTRDDLGKAIVARTVRLKVTELAGADGEFSDEWRRKFQEQGLISLSEEIEKARNQARAFVRRLRNERLGKDETATARLDTMLKQSADALLVSANAIRNSHPGAARELEEYAEFLKSNGGKTIRDDFIRAHSATILSWGAAKQEIPVNLGNLVRVIQALRTTHQTVDAWIQTDVSVSGDQIAQLVGNHQKMLGLADGGGAQ